MVLDAFLAKIEKNGWSTKITAEQTFDQHPRSHPIFFRKSLTTWFADFPAVFMAEACYQSLFCVAPVYRKA